VCLLRGVDAERSYVTTKRACVNPKPDDVLTRLLGLLDPDPTKLPPDPGMIDLYGIRRNLAGFAIGCAVPPSGTIAFAMQ
jgi:hypothetical protein